MFCNPLQNIFTNTQDDIVCVYFYPYCLFMFTFSSLPIPLSPSDAISSLRVKYCDSVLGTDVVRSSEGIQGRLNGAWICKKKNRRNRTSHASTLYVSLFFNSITLYLTNDKSVRSNFSKPTKSVFIMILNPGGGIYISTHGKKKMCVRIMLIT